MRRLLVLLLVLYLIALAVYLVVAPPYAEGAYVIEFDQMRFGVQPALTGRDAVVPHPNHLAAAAGGIVWLQPGEPPPPELVVTARGLPVTLARGTLPIARAAPERLLPAAWLPAGSASEVVAGPGDLRRIALTFDAGAGATYTPAILGALRARGVQATMFLTGRWVDANPALVRRMVADGHELANHSYSHVDFTRLSETAIAAELDETESAVARAGGTALRPFFRPPFGARNTRVLRVVAAEGYTPVYWTVDSGDWQAGLPAGQVLARVSLAARPGAIVVSHLDSWQTAAILSALIDQLRARGYELVTLSELLGGTFGN